MGKQSRRKEEVSCTPGQKLPVLLPVELFAQSDLADRPDHRVVQSSPDSRGH